jgi:F420-non-reducing hydrogenase small subunit
MGTKATVAIQNLSYCGGCEVALSDLGQDLLDLLDSRIELVYSPLFMSAKDYSEVDVALITGAVRTEEDLHLLQAARRKARYLVAFGACPAFGGILGLANLLEKRDLLDTAYRGALGQQSGHLGDALPQVMETLAPLEAHTKVDFTLPGCPPPPAMIAEFLDRVLRKIRLP